MSNKKKKMSSQKKALKKQAKERKRRIQVLTFWTAIIVLLVGGMYYLSTLSVQQAKPTNEEVFNYENQPVIGKPDAPVRIVEFGDYKCPVCQQFAENIFPQLKRDFLDTGKARMYFLDNPFIGEDSVTAAMAGEAVYRQKPEAFWTFYEAVYANQGPETDEWATVPFLVELAKKVVPEIDHARMERELNDQAYEEAVMADREIARKLGVDSVPTLFINGKKVDESAVFNYSALKELIEEALMENR